MSTAEEMNHPAYTMKDSIGAKYIFFGKVRYFTYQMEAEGVKELLPLSVPTRSFKSQVTGYHEITTNPTGLSTFFSQGKIFYLSDGSGRS